MRRLTPSGRAEVIRYSFAEEIPDAWEGRSLMLFQVEYVPAAQALTIRFQVVPGLESRAEQQRFAQEFRMAVSEPGQESVKGRISAGISVAAATEQPSNGHETVMCPALPYVVEMKVGEQSVELDLPRSEDGLRRLVTDSQPSASNHTIRRR